MSQKNVFPAGSSVLDQYVISTRGTAQFGDNSNNYLVGVTPTTYNTYQVATVGNINNFGLTPQNNTGSSTGTYYSNGVSAMRIPADSSNNRPPVGYAGYIRYNTNTNYVEYYNSNTTTWLPISQQSPLITNITPGYISQDTSYNVYSITGTNFNSNTSITFVGVNNSLSYSTSTVLNSPISLTTTASYALSDITANPSGYYVVVTNGDTGLSSQYGTIITFNPGPTWTTSSGNLGTAYGNITYTTANSPFTPLNATDPNTPVTYYYSTPPVGTTITLDASTGLLIGTTPIVTSTTTYNFYAIARDGLPVPGYSVPRAFSFTIATTLATITGSATYYVGYTDANGQNYSATTPISGGYTVYWFTAASSATFTTSPYTPPYITYLVVGGGGGGGGGDGAGSGGGGGGAGGVQTGLQITTVSTGYTVTVGTGGAGGTGANVGSSGTSSTFASVVAAGGGGGGNNFVAGVSSQASGGGGGLRNLALGGSGNTSSTNPPQGNAGGNALLTNAGATGRGGGGGGVMMAGVNGSGNNANAYNATGIAGGTGGNGLNFTMVQGTTVPGAATGYGGGGGGGAYDRPAGLTYIGGGGAGALQTGSSSVANGTAGTANTGGGGGGASTGLSAGAATGGAGGSGFVLLRHLTIPLGSQILASYAIGTSGYTITYVNNANTVVGSATFGGYTIISFPAASLVNQIIPTSSTNNYQAASSVTQTYTFTPTSTMGPVAYLIVGGGGGGGCRFGGGGGAGGVVYGYATLTNGTTYTITVGAGGAGGATNDTTGMTGTSSSISSSGGGTTTAYGGGGGNSENNTTTGSTFGSGGGGSYAASTYNTPGSGTGGQGFSGGYGNNSTGVGRNGGGGGGAGGPGGAGSTTIGYAGGSNGSPETQTDSYAYGAPYGGQAIGLSITGTLTAYGGGGGGCDMRQDSGASMGYGGGGGINYYISNSNLTPFCLGYPSGNYYLSGLNNTGYGCYGVFGGGGNTNSNANISGGRGGGSNGNSSQGATGSCYNSSGVGEAGRHGTGGGGGGGAYMTTALTYNPNSIPGGQPGGAGGSGIVILRFPSYIC